jgi:uncharacterized lipoprotein YmbA
MMRRSGVSNRTIVYRIGTIALLGLLCTECAASQRARAEWLHEEKSAEKAEDPNEHLKGVQLPRRGQTIDEVINEADSVLEKETQRGWAQTLAGFWQTALSLLTCFDSANTTEVPTLMPSTPPRKYSNYLEL